MAFGNDIIYYYLGIEEEKTDINEIDDLIFSLLIQRSIQMKKLKCKNNIYKNKNNIYKNKNNIYKNKNNIYKIINSKYQGNDRELLINIYNIIDENTRNENIIN